MRVLSRYESAHSIPAAPQQENERMLRAEYEAARWAHELALLTYRSAIASTEAMLGLGYHPAQLPAEFAAEARARAALDIAARRVEGFRVALERLFD